MSRHTVSKPTAPGAPKAVQVHAGNDGAPVTVAGRRVEEAREDWLAEDKWWTEQPIRRHYWELITTSGSNLIVFHDLIGDRWFSERE